ncbi:indolepyruvate ferredoxin oxidoreductase subunit alpha [Heliophilum fasciatum]|uniref:Indolepyruvate oxidoreductase subunit IorA n=1 Tax=Heliophilum fasciatum TaxID=35700 RepID=A0A4R2RGT1_9FIRM|nr:indolepyruvate ferredoxin oxidoreductase subunit alpha [Heliophilum fasciatum]MCW2278960.1 indolepyruvate ferredoxin oxidoreductase alpha subunit [Heliophilum fasciatum]TCP61788.1 indolepyruvate ferredoxin oxidoreductase alpha subunit [Heliophilum fasciatum]
MKVLMTGNEAIARGAYEYGVGVAAAYPGTPSTEILENIATYKEIPCQWSPNEKVALEVGIGAAIAGARTIVTMKHVGVNVAADPLLTVAYTGVRGGLVLVSADDPGMHSSQNEQDNRFYGPFAKIPVLEPSDSQEAKEMVGLALEMSETFDTPVILRITTRIAHSRSLVTLNEPVERTAKPYSKDAKKYVMIPAYGRARRLFIEERDQKLGAFSETCPVNRIEAGSEPNGVGILTSGIAYSYVKEAFPQAPVLRVGLTHPIPKQLITDWAQGFNHVIVVEELEPYLENQLRAMGLPVLGKPFFPPFGELSVQSVQAGVQAALASRGVAIAIPETNVPAPFTAPMRPPVLCPGCPHRGVFYVLKQLKAVVSGDIGCYTLGTMAPLDGIDTCICMGASISGALGMEKAHPEMANRIVAVIGDSTFLHSGVTGLMDIVYNGGTSTVMILDNSITAMTGHQHHPGTGQTLMGDPAPMVDYEALVRALGVKRVVEVDPLDIKQVKAVLKEEMAVREPSVIIARRPCALRVKNDRPLIVENCKGCRACIGVGCPALSMDPATRKAVVDATLCTGCGVCARVCMFDCFRPGGE